MVLSKFWRRILYIGFNRDTFVFLNENLGHSALIVEKQHLNYPSVGSISLHYLGTFVTFVEPYFIILMSVWLERIYWKEKETHIHFGCYLYQRCIYCVNEFLFDMLSIHICTHCDTFLCKKTTCVSHVNGKGDRGYEWKIQSVSNNIKNWFFKCSGFR